MQESYDPGAVSVKCKITSKKTSVFYQIRTGGVGVGFGAFRKHFSTCPELAQRKLTAVSDVWNSLQAPKLIASWVERSFKHGPTGKSCSPIVLERATRTVL